MHSLDSTRASLHVRPGQVNAAPDASTPRKKSSCMTESFTHCAVLNTGQTSVADRVVNRLLRKVTMSAMRSWNFAKTSEAVRTN
jgi:hypothetical protein